MAHRLSQIAIAAVLAAPWLVLTGDAQAPRRRRAPGWASPEPNYYAMPTGAEGLTAALYPCPRPTPPLVGQTQITDECWPPTNCRTFITIITRPAMTTVPVTRTSVTWNHRLLSCLPLLTNSVPGVRTRPPPHATSNGS